MRRLIMSRLIRIYIVCNSVLILADIPTGNDALRHLRTIRSPESKIESAKHKK